MPWTKQWSPIKAKKIWSPSPICTTQPLLHRAETLCFSGLLRELCHQHVPLLLEAWCCKLDQTPGHRATNNQRSGGSLVKQSTRICTLSGLLLW